LKRIPYTWLYMKLQITVLQPKVTKPKEEDDG
jgi:hypothetical protein